MQHNTTLNKIGHEIKPSAAYYLVTINSAAIMLLIHWFVFKHFLFTMMPKCCPNSSYRANHLVDFEQSIRTVEIWSCYLTK